MSSTDNTPEIEYPRDYGLRVVGDNVDQLERDVVAILEHHCPESFDSRNVTSQKSTSGNYKSVRVRFRAESAEHVSVVYQALSGHQLVRMVL
ncbi:HP0495 family protein [Larsenimonas suaedae]|uniref:UPF0250 protein QC825_07765 n=1 Tax=Larsenimonas suaedae TaxID=1851019 RepID=A0ABU1GXA5_9GAMM|nr:DUF493 domain-containing protein [Larsenimonas suaedae]MCM2971254.1 DUF493 domain-containing protein [Larsenimonas suaedae]MDR5895963.1 DUF493 domain-containing protein [Larsenimonas suaedae]